MKYLLKSVILILTLLVFVLIGMIIQATITLMGDPVKIKHTLNNHLNFINENVHQGQIVPNLVHYIIFGNVTIHFITFLSITSVIKIQRPSEIWIHTDTFEVKEGLYWSLVQHLALLSSVQLSVKHLQRPTYVFGQRLSSVHHSTDIGRIQVLSAYGGIYLDTDTLLLKPLHSYLNYEAVVGWPENDYIGTQLLICKKNARFLSLWLNGYRRYKPRDWYYNAGRYPTKEVLERDPSLAFRVKEAFGVRNLLDELYTKGRGSGWREKWAAVHTLARHHPAVDLLADLDERSVRHLDLAFGEIARYILFGVPPSLTVFSVDRPPVWSSRKTLGT